MTTTDNLREAVRLLGAYTAGRFDPWDIAGPSKASCRQHVLSVLVNGQNGKNVPRAQCGVNAIRDAFYAIVKPAGDHIAGREKSFRAYCRELLAETPATV